MIKIECSEYLQEKMDEMTELISLLNDEFDYASILGCDTKGKTFQVSKNEMVLKDSSQNETGFVVRILNNGRYFEYAFNEWEDVDTLYETILKMVNEDLQIQKESGFLNYDEIQCQDDMVYETYDCQVVETLDMRGCDEVLNLMNKVKEKVLLMDERIVNVNMTCHYVHVSKVFIAQKKELSQSYVLTEFSVGVTVREGRKTKNDQTSLSGQVGLEILDQLETKAKEALKNALELLEASPMLPGVYDVICTPEISGLIAHEAFGHGVEMDMFVKNRALAKDYIGKQVASPLVTMVDGARPKHQVASYLFDDEGNLGHETILIKDGILMDGISDEASSLRLHQKPTGNGRRESFERKAYSRMTNTYFESGNSKLEDMIASIDYGFLLDGVLSGMEDPKHWGIECMITKAKEISQGKLTGRIFSPVILTGYVPDLLKSISMVSNTEVELSGSGYCGKGYKEFVKVSDGGPYLKAKARLG